MVNIFSQGEGDIIEFPTDSFTVSEAIINGTKQNFLEYLHTNKIDIRFPLVAKLRQKNVRSLPNFAFYCNRFL